MALTPEQQAIIERVQERQTEQAPTQTQAEIIAQVKQRTGFIDLAPKLIETRRGKRPNPVYDAEIEELAERTDLRAEQLPEGAIQDIQRERVRRIPELSAVGLSNFVDDPGLMRSIAVMTSFDPDEVGQMLRSADPNIGIVTTPEGERIAVNNRTQQAVSLNKLGPSLMDAIQIGGTGALFTAGGVAGSQVGRSLGATTLPRQALAVGATEGGIQAGVESIQESAGGEFDGSDVALAAGLGAAAPVAFAAGKALVQRFKPYSSLIDEQTGLPTPAFRRELDRRNLVFGDVIDDMEALGDQGITARPKEFTNELVRRKIERGDTQAGLASLRLEGGRVVNDDLATATINAGFKPRQVQFMKTANTPTRRKMLQMLGLRRRVQVDETAALRDRPSKIAGDEALDRYRFIQDEAKKLRRELNTIVKNDFAPGTLGAPGQPTVRGLQSLNIDPTNIRNEYVRLLDNLDIQATRNPDRSITLNYNDSIISKNPQSQKIIEDITDLLLRPTGPDINAADMHKIKRQIDDLINWRAQGIEGIPASGRNFAKNIRREINQAIRDVSPEYAAVNDKLSKAITALENFDDVMGRRFDPFIDRADETVGQELRKLMSNYNVRNVMQNALDGIDETASLLGRNYDTDLGRLVNFNYALQERFGTEARTSLQGAFETAQSVERVLTGETGPGREAVRRVFGKVAGKLSPTDEQAFDSLQRLLRRDN